MKYYIIAGEASGDLHGAGLIKALLREDPCCKVRCWGGDLMAAAGGTIVKHYRDTAVMGFTEVFSKIGKIAGNLNFCKKDLLAYNPDAVVLIDYPGFNLRIARFSKKHGFNVFYFIPPKVWARNERRIADLKRFVDKVLIIFPFEIDFYKKHGVDAEYVGNPLVEIIEDAPVRKPEGTEKIILLFAGSRRKELEFMMPRFIAMEKLTKEDSRFSEHRLIIVGAPSMELADYKKYLPEESTMDVIFGETYSLLKQAEAAVVCSGTASLEAALTHTPQVVCYGLSKLTYALAKLLVKVKYISLANLILDKEIFRELIQDAASPEGIKAELDRLLFDMDLRLRMESDYAKLSSSLGSRGALQRAAAVIVKNIKK